MYLLLHVLGWLTLNVGFWLIMFITELLLRCVIILLLVIYCNSFIFFYCVLTFLKSDVRRHHDPNCPGFWVVVPLIISLPPHQNNSYFLFVSIFIYMKASKGRFFSFFIWLVQEPQQWTMLTHQNSLDYQLYNEIWRISLWKYNSCP